MTTFCDHGHDGVWWDTPGPCWVCAGPGVPARAELHPARHWRNPASWVAEMEAS